MNKLLAFSVVLAVFGLASAANSKRRPFHTVDFDHFWTLSEVCSVLASIEEYGTTTEGRRVKAFVIRKGAPKPTIIIEAGLRPR
jgi:hypothetical protein